MSLNLVNAFSFMFKEKNWFVKFLIGSVLFFFIKIIAISMDVLQTESLPRFGMDLFMKDGLAAHAIVVLLYFGALILVALSVWMHSTSFGYIITTIRRYMRGEEDIIPDWDDVMGKLFRRGFKAFLALFIYTAALWIFATGAWFLSGFLLLFLPFGSLLTTFVAAFVVVYALILMPAQLIAFCEKDRFLAVFDFVRARQIMLKSIGNYVIMLLMLALVFALSAILTVIFFHTKIGILVLPIVCFYLMVVMGNIVAQYYVNYCKE